MVKRITHMVVMMAIMLACLCVTTYAADVTEESKDLQYSVVEGSLYYESCWGFGSGRYGVVETDNIYTDIPCIVGLNGYAFLDANGHVISSEFHEEETNIPIANVPEEATKLFVHFSGFIYRNGWTDVTNIRSMDGTSIQVREELRPFVSPDGMPSASVYDGASESFEDIIAPTPSQPEQKTSEEVVKQIETIVASTDALVLVDVSGSMTDSQERVIAQLNELNLSDETPLAAFSDFTFWTSYQVLVDRTYYSWIKGSTNLYGALNNVVYSKQPNTIVLISDLRDNHSYSLFTEENNVEHLVVYMPYLDTYSMDVFSKEIAASWSASVSYYEIK